MALMTIQPPLPFAPVAGARPLGQVASMAEDADGGQIFLYGNLQWAWDAGDDAMRRMAAVKLADMKAASVREIAAGFGVTEDTLWRCHRALNSGGFPALVSTKRGPKGGSKLTEEVIVRIHELKATGLANTRIGAKVGVSEFSVRRALTLVPATEASPKADETSALGVAPSTRESSESVRGTIQEELPLLPAPTDRSTERVAASLGELPELAPVFAPAARVPLAGLFFALPALETTMLLPCAATVFTDLSHTGSTG